MTTRPPDVRIDDLADPLLPPEIGPAREAMAQMGEQAQLTEEALLADAAAQTGLDDFGDARFRQNLRVLVASLDGEAGLSPAGRFASYSQLLQLLKNRLLIEDLLKRHPEIHDSRIERPIIIAGLPRTGTTHLHNLLSCDPALRSLPYWESLEPVLDERERPAAGEPDPRIVRTQAAVQFIDAALPYFKRMHEMTVDHKHEEIQLLAIDFSTMFFETMAPMPAWRDYYKATDQAPSYEYMKKVLKVLQWQRGGTRWILKSPQHLEQMPTLMKVFPDATVIVTHRDPIAVTQSVATMVAYSSRLALAKVDPKVIGRYWAARIEDKLRACVRDRELLPADRSLDVRFDQFMADDMGTVEKIYTLAGQPMTAAGRGAMRAFVAENPRGKFGGVRYDLAQLGVDREERRRALAFYIERFGVALES
jgi:hypothetical protein